MKILIYLGHPAQYHFFKFIIKNLKSKGHDITLLLKTKDILEELVRQDGVSYINIQNKIRKNNTLSILLAQIQRTFKVLRIAKKKKVNLIIGTDASVAQAAKLLRIKSITVLEDDISVIPKLAKITYPFSDSIVVPTVCDVGKWHYKKIPYEGYMKLSYLHPNYFAGDKNIVSKYINCEKFILIRLAQLTAHHDVGINGLNVELVLKIIEIANQTGHNVFISSEARLDDRITRYQLKIETRDIHHVMASASLLVSDSQSMSVEAAMLGIPSIRFSDFSGRISVLEELEHKYHLTFGVKTSQSKELIKIIQNMLIDKELSDKFTTRREQMLSDKIDVTAFFVWLIENYPDSKEIIKKDFNFQYNFK